MPALPYLRSASVFAKDMAYCCFKKVEKRGPVLLNLPRFFARCGIEMVEKAEVR